MVYTIGVTNRVTAFWPGVCESADDLHAARSYSLISPPRTLHRRMSATAGRCSRPGRPCRSPAAAASWPGAGDAGCNARRTRPAPPAGAPARRSASGQWPPSRRCAPSARHRRSPAAGRTGVLTTRVPFPAETSSNAAVNLLSRSRIKNLNRPARSPTSITRFRVCWVVQAPAGCSVTPRMCTARVWMWFWPELVAATSWLRPRPTPPGRHAASPSGNQLGLLGHRVSCAVGEGRGRDLKVVG